MYEIVWSNRAENKFLDILEYWNFHNHSNQYSLKIISEVDRIENLLAENPYLGRVANDENIRVISILRKFLLLRNKRKYNLYRSICERKHQ